MRKAIVILMSLVLIEVISTSCTPPGSSVRRARGGSDLSSSKHNDDATVGEHFNADENDFEVEEEDMDAPSDTSKINGKERIESNKRELFFQKGIASWYGREFHGKITASGERFDMNKFTAAHKTLPLGSVVEVKNFDNGKSVQVTINDRGPYKGNRILDLSYKAAKRLDMIQSGEAMVGITILRRGDRIDTNKEIHSNTDSVEPVSDDVYNDSDAKGGFLLQAGAFYSRKNAKDLQKRVEDITSCTTKLVHDGDMYKVRIEGLRSRNELDRYKKMLETEDISSFSIEK